MASRPLRFNYGSPLVIPTGMRFKYRLVNANYVADTGGTQDTIIGVDTTAAVQVTLPAQKAGRVVFIHDEVGTGANTNNITVVPPSGTIDGAANSVINTARGSRAFYSNGVTWHVLYAS